MDVHRAAVLDEHLNDADAALSQRGERHATELWLPAPLRRTALIIPESICESADDED
jgi:hypothetical protein